MGEQTVTEAAAIIEEAAEQWTGEDTSESIEEVTRRIANSLSPDPIFNMAAWMKYNFGACLSGESDECWLQSAEELRLIFAAREFE